MNQPASESISQPSAALPASAYGDDPNWPPAPRPDGAALSADTDHNIRCGGCGKLLIEFATRPYSVRCPRCKAVKVAAPHPAA